MGEIEKVRYDPMKKLIALLLVLGGLLALATPARLVNK